MTPPIISPFEDDVQTDTNDYRPNFAAPSHPPADGRYDVTKQSLMQRVRRSQRSLIVAALVLFGLVAIWIVKPNLGLSKLFATVTNSTTSTSSSNGFFSQSGSSNNGTTQQSPVTTSRAS